MSIKELFNQNRNHEKINNKILELEKNFLKVNALEVRINKLLKLEEKIYSIQKVNNELIEATKKKSEIDRQKNELGGDKKGEINRLNQAEIKANEILTLKKMENFFEKVTILEATMEKLEQRMNNQDNVQASIQIQLVAMQEMVGNLTDSIEIHATAMPVIENEQIILKRLESIEEKLDLSQELNEYKTVSTEEPIVIKEIHIDKFYLEKYEQNNNIAQIGIKELSGVLNIGATFGNGAIPKEMSEQLRAQFKDMVAMKADKNQNEEQLSDKETEEIFSEHEDFTEVIIEDDTDEGMEFKY